MSELASESMNTSREADAIDGGGRAREHADAHSSQQRAWPSEEIA
jgi:hypothetical protein